MIYEVTLEIEEVLKWLLPHPYPNIFRSDKIDVATEDKAIIAADKGTPKEETKYWRKLLKAFTQPAMILLFFAAAMMHTGTGTFINDVTKT